jgi:imidazolonepropionase-like amidohydrolase
MKIFATTLYDGKTVRENCMIAIKGDSIDSVSSGTGKADFGGVVTPAFIDAHSHIGLERQGEPYQEGEVNDHTRQINPLLNPLNSIYFDDRAFTEAVDFGVLYSCVVPGSGNLVGGRAVIIRNFAKSRSEALYSDYGYKMALGYNPRSTDTWKGTRPNTRMGVYSILESKFDEVLAKESRALLDRDRKLQDISEKSAKEKYPADKSRELEKQAEREFELTFDPVDRALLEILHGEKRVKVHVHKADDVDYLVELHHKYGLLISAEHLCDVHDTSVFKRLAELDIPIVYGPVGSLDYKVELKNASYKHARLLMESKATFGLMTDHPVILSPNLRESLKYFLIQGMEPAEAIGLITDTNAKILGIDDRLGTISPGKLASLIVWDRDPLHLAAKPIAVIAEGAVVRLQPMSRKDL